MGRQLLSQADLCTYACARSLSLSVMELAAGGDLFDYLNDQPNVRLPEPECKRLARQCLAAVGYFHARGYIHGDIKVRAERFGGDLLD